MEFGFITFLFLIYETSFYLVRGQTTNKVKSDCTLLYNFLKGDTKDYADNCCNDPEIKCFDDGYIQVFSNKDTKLVIPNLTNFPHLSKIQQLNIYNTAITKEIPQNILNLTSLKILEFNNNGIEIIPPAIQNLSKLELLYVINNALTVLPNELFSLPKLKTLSLSANQIEIIPPAIQNLSVLENLYIYSNLIKDLPDELFNLKRLKFLNLRTNNIEVIPPTIQNLKSSLEELYLFENKITVVPDELFNLTKLRMLNLRTNRIEHIPPAIKNLERLNDFYIKENNLKDLPPEIFTLEHLNKITLHDNPNLKTKIINFGDSTIKECKFNNINVICYQHKTCETILFNDRNFTDAEADKEFKICSQKEVNEILNELGIEKGSSPMVTVGIIIGCIVFILIGALVAFILIKRKRSKNMNKSDEGKPNEAVKIIVDEKQNNNINNNISTSNVQITNNNDNNNDDDKFKNKIDVDDNNKYIKIDDDKNKIDIDYDNKIKSKKDIENKNIHNVLKLSPSSPNNLNQNIRLNLSGYSPNMLPGMVFLIGDPQNPGNYIMSNVATYNNNNNNNNNSNINDDSLEPPPSYDEINTSMDSTNNNNPSNDNNQ